MKYPIRIEFSLLFAVLALFLLSSCNRGTKDMVQEESLGLRSSNLYNEDASLGEMPVYGTGTPGSGITLDRSFENAPPLIPHTIEGFLPITIKTNMCLSCHMPAQATSTKSTPIPISHFTKYRPEVTMENGIVSNDNGNNLVSTSLGENLYQGRYNCSQCHVPQADIDPAVENTFQAVYRAEQDKSKSNLSENIGEGVR